MMATGDVLAVVAATVVTILVVVLALVLVHLARTLRDLRAAVEVLQNDALELLDDARAAVHEAAGEIDRVERLVTSAERLDEAKHARRRVAAPGAEARAPTPPVRVMIGTTP
jgi:predicted Holliday junction resolvase-like endonuclease